MRTLTRLVGPTARAAAFALLLAPCAVQADEGGTVYQWTDSNGVTRYTPSLDRVPGSARDTVLTIQSGDEEPGNEPIYFEPDPRASEVAVPEPVIETAGSPVVVTPLEGEPQDPDEKIHALEAEIAQLEDQLKEYISEPGAAPGPDIPPELREIAARLPELQGELARLQRRPAPAHTP